MTPVTVADMVDKNPASVCQQKVNMLYSMLFCYTLPVCRIPLHAC